MKVSSSITSVKQPRPYLKNSDTNIEDIGFLERASFSALSFTRKLLAWFQAVSAIESGTKRNNCSTFVFALFLCQGCLGSSIKIDYLTSAMVRTDPIVNPNGL